MEAKKTPEKWGNRDEGKLTGDSMMEKGLTLPLRGQGGCELISSASSL